MSGWGHGGGGNNMDPAFLAQTMINVAQNLLSTQQQAVSMLYPVALLCVLSLLFPLEHWPKIA